MYLILSSVFILSFFVHSYNIINIIEDDTIKDLNETYKFSKEHDSVKEKDDYDIEI